MSSSIRTDPLPSILAVLTVITGLVDAISVLGLQRVFTANMTGNIVFLGFAIAGQPGFSVPRSVAALVGFLAGALCGGRLGVALADGSRRRWLLVVATIEAALFLAASWLAVGYDIDSAAPIFELYALIGLTAVAMGLRNATVRRLALPDLTTTVLTLTLTGIAADSSLAGGSNTRLGRRLLAVVAMLAGAALGAVLVSRWGLALPLLLSGLSIFLVTVGYALHPASSSPARGEK